MPIGYDAKDRTLVINESEAVTVRAIFRLYLEPGTVHALETEVSRAFAYGLLTARKIESVKLGHAHILQRTRPEFLRSIQELTDDRYANA